MNPGFLGLDFRRVDTAPCRRLQVRDGDMDAQDELFAVTSGAAPAVVMLRSDGSGDVAVVSRTAIARHDELIFAELDGEPGLDVVTSDELLTKGLHAGFGPVLQGDPAVIVMNEADGRFVDLNGDGLLDRVQIGDGVAAALAVGGGKFSAWQRAPLAGLVDPDAVEVMAHDAGDIDGDGAEDVVVLLRIDNALSLRAVTVVRADAMGNLRGETATRLASTADTVLVADLDGDDVEEIVVVDTTREEVQVTVLRAADGYLTRMQRVALEGAGDIKYALFDVQLDGRLDLMIFEDDGVWVARGQGDGGFGVAERWGDYALLSDVSMRDVDGDRRTDMLAISRRKYSYDNNLLMIRGGADGAAGARRLLTDVSAAAIADLDGDGVGELLVGWNGVDDSPIKLAMGRAAGDSYVFGYEWLPNSGGELLKELAAHDWDGDGLLDVAVVDSWGMTIVRQQP